MQKILTFIFLIVSSLSSQAATLKGSIKDEKGEALAFASIYIKGTSKGTTSNLDGNYSFEVPIGKHTMICQYVGYKKQEFEIEIKEGENKKNITLERNETSLKEVKIKDPENQGLAIIKKAIKERSRYNKLIDKYAANAYIKGNFKLNDVPNMGALSGMFGGGGGKKSGNQKKEEQDELEKMKGIIYLSESYNEIFYKKPDKLKIKVLSSRVSGDSQDYGLSSPLFINLYDNNVSISDQLAPRGIISPIAETATLNYRYELLGAYVDEGKIINRIKVKPRRKYEPLFSGVVEIVENEWSIYSADLSCTKQYGIEFADSIQIKQVYVPVQNRLMVKDQSMWLKLNIMGFDVTGNFVNVFTDYDFNFEAKQVFDKYLQEYADGALNNQTAHWDTTRLMPLDKEEHEDFIKKDSIEKASKLKTDSVRKIKNGLSEIATRGFILQDSSNRFSTTPFIGLNNFGWNTVEGLNYSYGIFYTKKYSKYKRWSNGLHMRYGVSNKQFNAYYRSRYRFGKTNKNLIEVSGGRNVFQYNNQGPVNELVNSFYTLLYGQNFLKIYQAWFANASYSYLHISGFNVKIGAEYQDRMSLANTNLFTLKKNHEFTENYPSEKIPGFEPRHNALIASLSLSYQPGRKYIKYPDRIESVSSHYPTFSLKYRHAGLLGNVLSDVNYSNWNAGMQDDMDLNLWGVFKYAIQAGGFIHNKKSYLADYTHFNGGQIILASPYLNSFQLAPYYLNSNTEPFYTSLNAEHHFNGFLTNKIPLFNRLKWYLVGATNMYYVNQSNNYMELSIGLENIGFKMFRFMRVDGIVGYTNFKTPVYGVRIGISNGILSISGGGD